ncbi:MAG: SDR family oxidoreductase [Candidatus Binataceae bacterium]
MAARGRSRYKEFVPYYASKTAVVALTESLALELAPEVLVNAVAPGPILMPPGLSPRENDEVIDATPLRRCGGAAEIAKTVLFLVESDFVTWRMHPRRRRSPFVLMESMTAKVRRAKNRNTVWQKSLCRGQDLNPHVRKDGGF